MLISIEDEPGEGRRVRFSPGTYPTRLHDIPSDATFTPIPPMPQTVLEGPTSTPAGRPSASLRESAEAALRRLNLPVDPARVETMEEALRDYTARRERALRLDIYEALPYPGSRDDLPSDPGEARLQALAQAGSAILHSPSPEEVP